MTGRQRVGIHQALAGRTLTVWANQRSVHFLLDGHLVTTVPSRLRPEDLAYLTLRYGARPAGTEPAPSALPRADAARLSLLLAIRSKSTARSTGTDSCPWEASATRSASPWQAAPSRFGWTATSCTPPPTTRSWAPGPAPSQQTNWGRSAAIDQQRWCNADACTQSQLSNSYGGTVDLGDHWNQF